MAVEDLVLHAGVKNDILVMETDDIRNAFATIEGHGPNARRRIVFDAKWLFSIKDAHYRLVLAHEVGHHVCRHTLDRYAAKPWDIELEASVPVDGTER